MRTALPKTFSQLFDELFSTKKKNGKQRIKSRLSAPAHTKRTPGKTNCKRVIPSFRVFLCFATAVLLLVFLRSTAQQYIGGKQVNRERVIGENRAKKKEPLSLACGLFFETKKTLNLKKKRIASIEDKERTQLKKI